MYLILGSRGSITVYIAHAADSMISMITKMRVVYQSARTPISVARHNLIHSSRISISIRILKFVNYFDFSFCRKSPVIIDIAILVHFDILFTMTCSHLDRTGSLHGSQLRSNHK